MEVSGKDLIKILVTRLKDKGQILILKEEVIMGKCTICGQEGEEICQECQAEKKVIENLKKEINKASSVLYELQNSYLSLTGRQYFGK